MIPGGHLLAGTGHDRSACKAFCGMSWKELSASSTSDAYQEWTREPAIPDEANDVRWCSGRCFDLRMPPIDSQLPNAEGRGGGADSRPSPTTPVREAHGTPADVGDGLRVPAAVPTSSGAQPGGSRSARQNIGAAVAGSASPANVPPAPAVGQRWRTDDTTYDVVGKREDHKILICRPIDGFFVVYGDQWCSESNFRHWTYLGPTPSPTSSPAAAPPPPPPPQVTRAAGRAPGVTCSHCLCTSAAGDVHAESCTREHFDSFDSRLSSAEWSQSVTAVLEYRAENRAHLERPFVPSVTDEDLFGRAVKS